MAKWICCANCEDEVTNDGDWFDPFLWNHNYSVEMPKPGDWFHPYYADVWCRNGNGTKAQPGREME